MSAPDHASGAVGGDGSATQAAPSPRRPARGAAHQRRQPPRAVVRQVACPWCGAPAGEPCQGRRGDRISHHIARVEVAMTSPPSQSSQPSPGTASTGPEGGAPAPSRVAAVPQGTMQPGLGLGAAR